MITKEQLVIALDTSPIDSGDLISKVTCDSNSIIVEGQSPTESGTLVQFRAVLPKPNKKDNETFELE